MPLTLTCPQRGRGDLASRPVRDTDALPPQPSIRLRCIAGHRKTSRAELPGTVRATRRGAPRSEG